VAAVDGGGLHGSFSIAAVDGMMRHHVPPTVASPPLRNHAAGLGLGGLGGLLAGDTTGEIDEAEVSPEASALASLVFIAADTVPYRQRERRNLNWLPT
jgi:hypothetical protein